MFMTLRRRAPREPDLPGVRGTLRIDGRTKALTKRLKSGDIAVIDHQDIDRVSAEALLACRPVAVINAASSITGRYPNLGPEILVDAGVPLVDSVGKDVMLELKDGQARVWTETPCTSATSSWPKGPSSTATSSMSP